MTHPWILDAADRLEAAAEVARDLKGHGRLLAASPVRVRVDFLAERLWETAQRLGILQTLGTGPRARLAHSLCDLYRVARRAHVLAQAEGLGAVADGLEAIASELRALLEEIAIGQRTAPSSRMQLSFCGASR